MQCVVDSMGAHIITVAPDLITHNAMASAYEKVGKWQEAIKKHFGRLPPTLSKNILHGLIARAPGGLQRCYCAKNHLPRRLVLDPPSKTICPCHDDFWGSHTCL